MFHSEANFEALLYKTPPFKRKICKTIICIGCNYCINVDKWKKFKKSKTKIPCWNNLDLFSGRFRWKFVRNPDWRRKSYELEFSSERRFFATVQKNFSSRRRFLETLRRDRLLLQSTLQPFRSRRRRLRATNFDRYSPGSFLELESTMKIEDQKRFQKFVFMTKQTFLSVEIKNISSQWAWFDWCM